MNKIKLNNISLENKVSKLLGKGFVKIIDCMPRVIPGTAKGLNCDYAVVQAARVSFDQGLKNYETDKKLIKYLLRHGHTSPFEMVRFKFHVKAPLFVQRQWIRHRTANVNEISGRYSKLKGEFYVPNLIRFQSKINKQSSDETITNENIKDQFDEYMRNSVSQYSKYNNLVEKGVSREMARIGLPLNLFTEFYWCIDLHNLLNFIRLRESPDSQSEIQIYANSIKELIRDMCPVTISTFEDYIQDSVTFSKNDCDQINIIPPKDPGMLCGVPLSQCKTTEQKELDSKIRKINNSLER